LIPGGKDGKGNPGGGTGNPPGPIIGGIPGGGGGMLIPGSSGCNIIPGIIGGTPGGGGIMRGTPGGTIPCIIAGGAIPCCMPPCSRKIF